MLLIPWLLGAVGATAAAAAKKTPASKPNFVVLFLDDHGWGDAGANVASVAGLPPVTETPNIDRMAAEGVRFADFHTGYSVCTASRGALLTGRLSPRTGGEDLDTHPGRNLRCGPPLKVSLLSRTFC